MIRCDPESVPAHAGAPGSGPPAPTPATATANVPSRRPPILRADRLEIPRRARHARRGLRRVGRLRRCGDVAGKGPHCMHRGKGPRQFRARLALYRAKTPYRDEAKAHQPALDGRPHASVPVYRGSFPIFSGLACDDRYVPRLQSRRRVDNQGGVHVGQFSNGGRWKVVAVVLPVSVEFFHPRLQAVPLVIRQIGVE